MNNKLRCCAAATASLIILTSCGGKNTPQAQSDTTVTTTAAATEQTETTSAPETTAAPSETTTVAETPAPEEEKQISFAERAVGTYYCNVNYDGGDERLKMEITEFGGNLYANCFLGGDTDVPPTADDASYSLWQMEIIPEDAGAFLTYTDSCEVGVLKYSNMSNMNRYWGIPDTGTMLLTEKGITFDNIDLVFENADKEIKTDLERYEGKSVFDIGPEVCETEYPPEIFGLWRYMEEYNDGKLETFIKFEHGDEEYTYLTVYRKEPGREAMLQKGGFCFEDEESIKALLYQTAAEPIEIDWKYKYKDGKLTITGSDIAAVEELVLEKVPESAVPLVKLADADDISEVKNGTEFTDINGDKRTVTLQFKHCDDIENNGGFFVRLGNLIFYREFDEAIRGMRSMYGSYTSTELDMSKGSRVCWYDRRTGETGLAFEDDGYGPLYYMNGMFYTQYIPSEGLLSDTDTDHNPPHVRRYYPDGSCCENAGKSAAIDWVEAFLGTSTYVSAVSADGRYMLLSDYYENKDSSDVNHRYTSEHYLYDGSSYTIETQIGDSESMEGWAIEDDDLFLVKYDFGKDKFIFEQYDTEDSDVITLGSDDYTGEAVDYGVCISDQIIRDGNYIYFSVAGVIGDIGYPEDYIIYKAEIGKENSLEIVHHGLPDGFEDYLPAFRIENGEIKFSEHPAGRAGLSERTKGDLVYYDTPDSSKVVIKDYAPKDIYEQYGKDVEKGETVTIGQTMEYVDGAVYVMEADCVYDPDYESGLLSDYYIKTMRWQRIVPGEEPEILYEFAPVP